MRNTLELPSVTISKIDELREINPRILFGFNLANDFTHVSKIMNENGITADMLLRPPSEGGSSKLSDPRWEDPDYAYPMIFWDIPKTRAKFILYNIDTIFQFFINRLGHTFPAKVSKDYDLVMSTPPTLYFHGHDNLIVYDGGMARILPKHKNVRSRMITKGYRMAKNVVYTNPDMRPLFDMIGIDEEKLKFIPFAIDYDRYYPKEVEKQNDHFVIFMYSRIDFRIKGSHHMLYAMEQLVKEYPNIRLKVSEWGNDLDRFKAMVKQMKLEKFVQFVDVVPKPELIKRIQEADVCADQFIIGSYGTAAPEAMSCGKAVLMYIKSDDYQRDFGGIPPIAQCQTIDGIVYQVLKLYEDRKYKNFLEQTARKWIIKKHNPMQVFEKKIDLIHERLI